MSIENLIKTTTLTSAEQFSRAIQDTDFKDYLRIGDTSALGIFDGLIIISNNIPSISAKVYSASKHMLWRCFFQNCAKAWKISQAATHLCLTDTDSLLIASSRPTNKFERVLHHHYSATAQNRALYSETPIAFYLAANEFCCWHDKLDVDSISESSIVFKHYFAHSRGLTTIFRFLVHQTKKKLTLFRNEVPDGQQLSCIYHPASKSYQLTMLPRDITLPIQAFPEIIYAPNREDVANYLTEKNNLGIRKSKGVKRSTLFSKCNINDFINVCKHENFKSRCYFEFGITKRELRLYIVKSQRRLLTRNSLKRLSYRVMATPLSHLNFPLYFKELLTSR